MCHAMMAHWHTSNLIMHLAEITISRDLLVKYDQRWFQRFGAGELNYEVKWVRVVSNRKDYFRFKSQVFMSA